MTGLLQDLRYTLRRLWESPGFTLIAVLSLALGIGTGTAVFLLVNGILLRSLPAPNPQELRVLRWTGNDVRMTSLNEHPATEGNRWIAHSVTHPMFLNLREQIATQADIFGFQPLQDVTARAKGEAFTAQGMMVSDNFFSGLEARPMIGRLLTAEDFAGSPTSVVIGYEWWEKHFARDPGVLGRTLTLNQDAYTVIGVLPQGFSGVVPGDPSEFYVPMSAQSKFLFRPITEKFHWFVRMMARLRPGVTDAQLGARLDVIFARDAGAIMNAPRMLIEPGRSGLAIDRNNYRKPLLLMLGVVGVVLLVACANLAGLLLARGAPRQHELAVRAALGAGRLRLLRQSLTESFILAALGGGLGIVLAIWCKTAISRLLAGSADGLHYDLSIDFTVLGFSLAIVLLTALLSGLLPAWRASRADPLRGLKSHGAWGTSPMRTGRALVVAQICMSLLLLTSAGLYVRTLINLTHMDAGFRPEHLLLFQLNAGGAGYVDGPQRIAFYERVQSALHAIPGVRGATFLENPLLSGRDSSGGFVFRDRPASSGETMQTHRLTVGETFFSTLGIPLLEGRALSASDTADSYKAIVVNQTFVREFSPEVNPIGRTVSIWSADWRIVGVCGDAKYANIKEAVPPMMYFPFRQRLYGSFSRTHLTNSYFALRTALPPLSLISAARNGAAAIDPSVPLANITTQEAVLDTSISQERLFATLCSALAGVALLLSCIGLYGLMAYHVTRRTSEIAIRMALGATRENIAIPILREALALAAFGIAMGLPIVLGLTQFIKSQLYGVAPDNPATLVGAASLLIAVVMLAAWIPARRAAKVDPLVALRYE